MAQSIEMNTTTPIPSVKNFRLQLEGMTTAAVYIVCFGWIHLGSGAELISPKVLSLFFVGLIVVPLIATLPMVLLRRGLAALLRKQPHVAAFLPFARFALYALQGILVWVATREAYAWVFGGAA
jgi:hypothetical protein